MVFFDFGRFLELFFLFGRFLAQNHGFFRFWRVFGLFGAFLAVTIKNRRIIGQIRRIIGQLSRKPPKTAKKPPKTAKKSKKPPKEPKKPKKKTKKPTTKFKKPKKTKKKSKKNPKTYLTLCFIFSLVRVRTLFFFWGGVSRSHRSHRSRTDTRIFINKISHSYNISLLQCLFYSRYFIFRI